jgi:hypothetical protein
VNQFVSWLENGKIVVTQAWVDYTLLDLGARADETNVRVVVIVTVKLFPV